MEKISPHSLRRGYIYAILAAVFFGASTPATKILLGRIDPWLLAGLLYLGSSIGLLIIFLIQTFLNKESLKEAPLGYKDWKWLGGAVLLGGVLGPVLLMLGLAKSTASVGSLLLNLESVFTALIAWLAFKEHTDRIVAFGMLLTVIGSVIVSWKGNLNIVDLLGPIFIVGACLCWAIDNNLTRKISLANPLQIAMIKSLIAGLTNTILAITWGAILPNVLLFFSISVVGFIGYGLSLLFFIFSLRYIGTARTGAYFSVAPFVGAGLSVIFLGDNLSWRLVLASAFMGTGIWLHLRENHIHEHKHEETEHQHRHVHDVHHKHEHLPTDPVGELHSHSHKHEALIHSHPHYPDIHHRHKH
jgi:drug/metabolite transporter (DMT)-like permease